MSNSLQPVIACTAKRGVFFGYAADPMADPLQLTDARMCIMWKNTGGVMGLADKGPQNAVASGTDGSRIGATADITIKEITAVFQVTNEAENAWLAAPVYGRK